MMKKTIFALATFMAIITGSLLLQQNTVIAVDGLLTKACADPVAAKDNPVCQAANSPTASTDLTSRVKSIINTLLMVLGIIAVIVIIIAGIMFSTSAGDPGKAKKAKDAILYAVIGLVVATLSYAIVNFVVGRL